MARLESDYDCLVYTTNVIVQSAFNSDITLQHCNKDGLRRCTLVVNSV